MSDVTTWLRKHRPEPQAESDRAPSVGRTLLALLGAVISTVLGVAGFVGALDSGRPRDRDRPPAAQNAPAGNPADQQFRRSYRPVDVLDSVETRLMTVGRAVARIAAATDRTAPEAETPETAKLYPTLRQILDEMQLQLATLDPSRLTADQLAKRDQLADRVEHLRCTLAAITGRDE
jgi:hypothetical protein